jgi:DNA-binding NarL/FixJ family response regulator
MMQSEHRGEAIAMRVLMVDDHVMFLQGLKNLLSLLAPALSIDTADALSQALQRAGLADYELVLLDWHLADAEGEQAISRLRDVGCTARIVVLSGETRAALIRNAIELGAAGFIPKTYSSERMLSALQVVLEGGIYLPAEVLREAAGDAGAAPPAAPRERLAELTPRQLDVYRAAARGLPNKLIARELNIAESTVKTHLSAVYAALGVANRTQAAYQASREGIRVG